MNATQSRLSDEVAQLDKELRGVMEMTCETDAEMEIGRAHV